MNVVYDAKTKRVRAAAIGSYQLTPGPGEGLTQIEGAIPDDIELHRVEGQRLVRLTAEELAAGQDAPAPDLAADVEALKARVEELSARVGAAPAAAKSHEEGPEA